MRRKRRLPLNLNVAQERQAYAAGVEAGRNGVAINPHPRGTTAHANWAAGYAAGRASRAR